MCDNRYLFLLLTKTPEGKNLLSMRSKGVGMSRAVGSSFPSAFTILGWTIPTSS